ncbi:MAG: DNA-deoxyinosine glycosylase [Phocaeicola sp.]
MTHFKESFLPLLCPEPQYLILGSIPGDRSIAMQAYYGHPQNRFWRLMAAIFHTDLPVEYDGKKKLLATYGIVLWDVAHKAQRKGSLDSAIRNEEPNEILNLLATHPTIHTVLFNGKKSEQLYYRYFKELPYIRYYAMPSTSPANAACKFDDLLERWERAFNSRDTAD